MASCLSRYLISISDSVLLLGDLEISNGSRRRPLRFYHMRLQTGCLGLEPLDVNSITSNIATICMEQLLVNYFLHFSWAPREDRASMSPKIFGYQFF
jgi:hypothetical protein